MTDKYSFLNYMYSPDCLEKSTFVPVKNISFAGTKKIYYA